MNTTNNTVLITGGSAGIGFELAALFAEQGNKVIITGRDEKRLNTAVSRLNNTTGIVSDVTDPVQADQLTARIVKDFPGLNIVINNAGKAHYYKLGDEIDVAEKAAEEMQTNYLAPIRLTEKLLPLLKKQKEAAIVNVTSIVAFAPGRRLATYAASKAALHAYTRTLRITLERTTANVKVFELMPPLVNTEFSRAIGGENGIPPRQVAEDLLKALAENSYEIHVGNTAYIYQLSLSSPAEALQIMNAAE
ncbi:MAG TPA: SDR family NAD(P)-dependent oxidoreductase [Puia sp.]|nr:SDR family NAD(P)-dependent oxidoreductase [Puia sp.]